FDAHNGREINTWGDAVIAEFESVVEAVRCAVAVQDAVECVDADGRPLRFRIGINLGDVIDDGHSVYGDGVNQAARLEAACEPGHVLISDTVHSLVHRQMALRFEERGEIETKDGEDPLSGFAVRLDRSNAPPEEPNPNRKSQLAYTARKASDVDQWLARQPRSVQIAGGFIVFFFLINLLFGGLSNPWFIFPAMPFAVYMIWKRRGAKPPGGEEAD
ncbi:MAG: adenylate/guanylate cyclase domain-containing protein, partial [Pseudomonadota bacterium]